MLTSYDKVEQEIEIWKELAKHNNKHLIRLYEVIDNPDHDYLYLISELGDMGTIMTYNSKNMFERNTKIMDHLSKTLFKNDKPS